MSFYLLLETGDRLLTENGDRILLEQAKGQLPQEETEAAE
jgi:hypothetical protein